MRILFRFSVVKHVQYTASYPGALIWDTLGYMIRIHEVLGQAGDARRGCWTLPASPFALSRHYDTSCKLDVNSPYAHHCFSQRDAWVRGSAIHLFSSHKQKSKHFSINWFSASHLGHDPNAVT